MNSIENCVFIFVINKLITEDPLTFMSPKSYCIQFRFKILDPVGLHDRLLFNLEDAFKGSSKLTHVEKIMELSRSRQHEFFDKLPKFNGR